MKDKSRRNKSDFPPGAFVPLYEFLPDLAERETRKVVLLQETYGLPADLYFLMESYCAGKDCDCRKVMINVISDKTSKILGTVGFGWESEEFYIEWMGDEELGRQATGTYLELGGTQTEHSNKCLELVNNSLRDPHYIDLLKKHYKSFKKLL